MVRRDIGRPVVFRAIDQSGGEAGRDLPVRQLDRLGAECPDHVDHQLRLLDPYSQALHIGKRAHRPNAVVDRARSRVVKRQPDETMALRARQDLLADRLIKHFVQVIERAEQKRQRKHVRRRNDRPDRRNVGAVEIDGPDPRLFDGLFLFAELARMEHPNAVASAAALLDHASHEHERLHRGIVLRLGVGDAELARAGKGRRRRHRDADGHRLAQIHSQIEGHSPCRLKQTNGDREYYSVRAKPVNRRAARLRAVRWTRSGKTLPRAPPPALEMPRPELCRPRWRLPPRPPMVAHWIGDAF